MIKASYFPIITSMRTNYVKGKRHGFWHQLLRESAPLNKNMIKASYIPIITYVRSY
jgi:hypothetical protein